MKKLALGCRPILPRRPGAIAWRPLLTLALLAGVWLSASPQTRPAPPQPPPAPPPRADVFERLELERRGREREALRAKLERERLTAEGRLKAWEELRADLPQMRQLLDKIAEQLEKPDIGTELSISLIQMADELERLAKRARRNVRKL